MTNVWVLVHIPQGMHNRQADLGTGQMPTESRVGELNTQARTEVQRSEMGGDLIRAFELPVYLDQSGHRELGAGLAMKIELCVVETRTTVIAPILDPLRLVENLLVVVETNEEGHLLDLGSWSPDVETRGIECSVKSSSQPFEVGDPRLRYVLGDVARQGPENGGRKFNRL